MRNYWVQQEKLLNIKNNQQVLEQLSLTGQRLQPRWKVRWCTQPCKSQAAGSAWGLSWMAGEMSLHPAGGLLLEKLWSGAVTGGSERAAQHRQRNRQDLRRDTTIWRALVPSCGRDAGPVHPWCNSNATCGESEEWKLLTSGIKRSPASPTGLQLRSWFNSVQVEEESDVLLSQASGPPHPKPCKTTRRKTDMATTMGVAGCL